jgi:predicted PurR-regulated permease PerM
MPTGESSAPKPSDAPSASAPSGTSSSRPAWHSLHLWQIQPLRDALILVCLVGLIYLGFILSTITVPILLALGLAYLFEPLVKKLTSLGNGRILTRRGVAILIIISAGLLIFVPAVLTLTFGLVQGASYARAISTKIETTIRSIDKPDDATLQAKVAQQGLGWQRIRTTVINLRKEHERLQQMEDEQSPPSAPLPSAPSNGTSPFQTAPIPNLNPALIEPQKLPATAPSQEFVEPDRLAAFLYRTGRQGALWLQQHTSQVGTSLLTTGSTVAQTVGSVFGSIASIAFGAGLTAFFFFFFVVGWGQVESFLRSLIPDFAQSQTLTLIAKMDKVIAGFVRGRLTICAILMVHYSLGYLLIGVPAWLILGPVVGLLCLLPFAGNLGLPVAMLLMWLGAGGTAAEAASWLSWQNNWWWIIAGPLLVHGIGQVLDDYILTPAIQGDSTGMDTPSILFASVTGGILGGFYGLLLAIPVAACLKIVIIDVIKPRFAAWAKGTSKDPLPLGNAPKH